MASECLEICPIMVIMLDTEYTVMYLRNFTLFEFHCTGDQGAILVCTTPADLVELEDPNALQSFLIQHAGVLYQQANSIRCITDEPFYIITGCVKAASWGISGYQGAPIGQVLRLVKKFADDTTTDRGKVYHWKNGGTGEARHWPNRSEQAGQYEGKRHSLFLRGFKLAFSPKFRARVDGLKHMGEGTGKGSSGDGNQGPGGKSNGPGGSSGSRPSGSGGSSFNTSTNSSSMNHRNTSLSNDIQIDAFPRIHKTVRFCCR